MFDRRRFMLAGGALVAGAPSRAALTMRDDVQDLDQLGKFERVQGRPGLVIGVPHGTADAGTLETGRILCERLGAGGVFVTGFWDPKTRQRINVNRETEELIGPNSEVLKQWSSPRAVAANARYVELVKEASQGPLKAFYEVHSNHRPDKVKSVEVSTLGLWRGEAQKFKDALAAARDRLDPQIPRLDIHVSPIDKVPFPNYVHASSIARLSAKGCAMEWPGHVFSQPAWRTAYAQCLAEAIRQVPWG
jgi:hypothetical protein